MALKVGQTTVTALRLAASRRADMPTPTDDTYITIAEWNDYILKSTDEVYDLIIQKYGDNYSIAPYYTFTTNGSQELYDLPDDFYKLIGVDLQYFNYAQGWVALKRFNMLERNKWSPTNFQNMLGRTNLQYILQGNQLRFIPIPSGVNNMRLIYVPRQGVLSDYGTITLSGVATGDTLTINGVLFEASPGPLIAAVAFAVGADDAATAVNLAAAILSLPDAWQSSTIYVAGQYVRNGGNVYRCATGGTSADDPATGPSGTGSGITDGSVAWNYCSPVLSSILAPTTDTVSPVVNVALTSVAAINGTSVSWSSFPSMAPFPQPSWTNVIDGLSGWDEYVVIDAAIKARVKEESDPSVLLQQKGAFIDRIEAAAENRDAGQPQQVTDVTYAGGNWPLGRGDSWW